MYLKWRPCKKCKLALNIGITGLKLCHSRTIVCVFSGGHVQTSAFCDLTRLRLPLAAKNPCYLAFLVSIMDKCKPIPSLFIFTTVSPLLTTPMRLFAFCTQKTTNNFLSLALRGFVWCLIAGSSFDPLYMKCFSLKVYSMWHLKVLKKS